MAKLFVSVNSQSRLLRRCWSIPIGIRTGGNRGNGELRERSVVVV